MQICNRATHVCSNLYMYVRKYVCINAYPSQNAAVADDRLQFKVTPFYVLGEPPGLLLSEDVAARAPMIFSSSCGSMK